jgi:hypothetical protein
LTTARRDLPVVGISWFMARRFTEELGKMDPDYTYRLPTEAEWEYAARADNDGLRPVGVLDLSDHAWFIEASGDQPHPVAALQASGFGLYDMLGNAWEWVDDWYAADSYGDGPARLDPQGPGQGRGRVRRGGSYHCPLFQVRPGLRAADTPDTHYSVIGFRVVAMPTVPVLGEYSYSYNILYNESAIAYEYKQELDRINRIFTGLLSGVVGFRTPLRDPPDAQKALIGPTIHAVGPTSVFCASGKSLDTVLNPLLRSVTGR